VGIEPCSIYFWVVIAATVPYFFVLMFIVAVYLNWTHRTKVRLEFPYLVRTILFVFFYCNSLFTYLFSFFVLLLDFCDSLLVFSLFCLVTHFE
jgi:hypothetical protein